LLDRAIAELQGLPSQSQASMEQLAICLNNKASLLIDVDVVEAQRLLEEANQLQSKLLASSAARPTAQTDLAITQCN
jgi:hypothetical protein